MSSSFTAPEILDEISISDIKGFLQKNPPKRKTIEKNSVDKLLQDNAKNILLLSVEEKIKKNKNLVGHKYYSIQNRIEKNCIILSRATNSESLYDKETLDKNLERILEIKKKCLLFEEKKSELPRLDEVVEQ